MRHLGMTPQAMHRFGGFRVQGKTDEGEALLLREAEAMVKAGVFSIVFEQ